VDPEDTGDRRKECPWSFSNAERVGVSFEAKNEEWRQLGKHKGAAVAPEEEGGLAGEVHRGSGRISQMIGMRTSRTRRGERGGNIPCLERKSSDETVLGRKSREPKLSLNAVRT